MRKIVITPPAVSLLFAGHAPEQATAAPLTLLRAAIFTDPVPDKLHPARMEVLQIPSGDVAINGIEGLDCSAV